MFWTLAKKQINDGRKFKCLWLLTDTEREEERGREGEREREREERGESKRKREREMAKFVSEIENTESPDAGFEFPKCVRKCPSFLWLLSQLLLLLAKLLLSLLLSNVLSVDHASCCDEVPGL